MTIEESKNLLKTKGYTHFDLKNFNKKHWDTLLPFKCNETNNFKKYINGVRADLVFDNTKPGAAITERREFDTIEEANNVKEEILKNHLENKKKEEYPKKVFGQLYYQKSFGEIYSKITNDDDDKNWQIYLGIISDIVKYYYDLDESVIFDYITTATYYDNGCFLANHSDGKNTGRICALLIYFNEEYDENDGGILILNNEEKIIPTFGKVAIIDLQSFDVPHQVTEVTGGIGRYAVLSFISKQTKFI
jgi:Rps23 Pro-64 3,4-dihydroxylase Tpa1-like proline 4-hydroxylase